MSANTLEKVNADYEGQLNGWIQQEKAAIDLIAAIGKLWFEKSIELVIFRNQLVDRSNSEIMNLHLYAKNIVKKPISVVDTALLANEILKANICPSKIDIGKLAFEWHQEQANFNYS
jgi:glyceraldehyde 3-phosphate dehydrogenase